jgi:hypothetical protein
MACNEFTNALAWAQQSDKEEIYPVFAYFTKHYGSGELSYTVEHKDAVHYATGEMFVINSPTPHLKGTLNGARNIESAELIEPKPELTYDIEIFPDGTVSYLMKLNGKAVGGMPPTKVQATCVNGVLLTAAINSEVVTVGLARKPKYVISS